MKSHPQRAINITVLAAALAGHLTLVCNAQPAAGAASGEKPAVTIATADSDDIANLSAEEVAQRMANPNTPLASLTLRNQWINWDGNLPGAAGHDSGVIEFQPAFPFPLNETTTLSFRPAFSYLIDQPVINAGTGQIETHSGFGDMGFDLAAGNTYPSGLLTRLGVSGSIPIGEDGLSSDTWALGPEALIGLKKDYGVFGFFPSHLWDVSGPATINRTTLQPLAVYLPGNAWAIGTSPIIIYDWHDDQWTVPLQLNISKTVKLGRVPVRFGLEVNYYLERPDALGEKWMVAFNITPIVPNVFSKLLGLSK